MLIVIVVFMFAVVVIPRLAQGERRTLRTVSLKEISVVQAWPAYPDTEIALRALRNGSDAERRRRALIIAEARKWA